MFYITYPGNPERTVLVHDNNGGSSNSKEEATGENRKNLLAENHKVAE